MCGKGLLKRLVPFFVALALGLFVANLFITIGLPNMRFTRGIRKHQEYHRRMEFEMHQLREENSRLKSVIADEMRNNNISGTMEFGKAGRVKFEGTINDLVPPPPPMTPVRAVKN